MRAVWPYIFLAALCLAIYGLGQSSLPVTDRDEARFMQATRQMLQSHDWIVVRFQDQLRAKKPAGVYWLQSASVGLFSTSASKEAWPYRIPSLLAAASAVLLTFAFAQAWFDRRVAFIAALALASSLLLGVEAHLATTDAALAAFTLVAQACLGSIYIREREHRPNPGRASVPFWVALGAAIMIKGPIAPMICGLTIATLAIADRDASWLRRLKPVMGVLILAAIIAPWVVAVSRATDGAFLSRALHEDLLPKLAGGQEGHGAPPGYYAAILTLSLWPASFFLWPAVWQARLSRAQPAVRFLLAWTIPSWLAFELVPTKLPHYTLPLHPAFAVLIALAVAKAAPRTEQISTHVWHSFWTACSLAFIAGVLWLPAHFGDRLTVSAAVSAFAAATTIICAWWFTRSGRVELIAASAIAATVAQIILIGWLLPTLSALWVSERVAAAIEPLDRGTVVASAGYYEPSLVFLLNGHTRQTTGREAAALLEQRRYAIALVEERELGQFLSSLSPGSAAEQGVIEGFNYSQGKQVRIHIFQPRRSLKSSS